MKLCSLNHLNKLQVYVRTFPHILFYIVPVNQWQRMAGEVLPFSKERIQETTYRFLVHKAYLSKLKDLRNKEFQFESVPYLSSRPWKHLNLQVCRCYYLLWIYSRIWDLYAIFSFREETLIQESYVLRHARFILLCIWFYF